jgi:signal transduction histidine kinase
VLLVDARRHVALANRAAAAFFGRNATRLRGTPIAQLLPSDAVTDLLRHFGPRRFRVLETCVAPNAQASLSTIKITAAPLTGRHAGGFTLLVIEDISDKATLEQQLVDSETQAAMGQLAAGLLHEVSNPLASLGSNLLFVRDALPAGSNAALTQALDASLDQLEQMRQLLGTLSRLPGRTAPRYEIADAHQVIRQCVTFVSREAERRGVSILATSSTMAATCEIDVRLIKQVLLNLLKNAMDAMPNGGSITIRTAQHTPEHEPAVIEIEVADTGTGIAECDLRRVFRPLFTTKHRGAGLGLSFCHQAVEEHGGSIRITTGGKDHGTTVGFSLPVRQPLNQND